MTEQIVKKKSNNPRGRPKRGDTVAELLRLYLGKPATDKDSQPILDATGRPVSRKQALVDRLYTIATTADAQQAVPAIKLIVEYTDGKPTQTVVQHNIDVTALSDAELEALVKGKE
jgi:hypothetical protein